MCQQLADYVSDLQLDDMEMKIGQLTAEKKELVRNNESLREKAQRGVAAVEGAASVQQKLETKYTKMASKLAAEQQEHQAAQAKVAELQVCVML
jgi:chromosome segregation ATPase